MVIDQGAALLNLQDIDLELFRLKAELENLPERSELSHLKTQHKEIQKKMLGVLARKKDLEIELESLEDERKQCALQHEKLTESFNEAAGHRKAQILERELSGLAKRVEKLDFTESGLLLEFERAQELEQKALRAQDTIKAQIQKLEILLKEKARSVYERVEELAEEREQEMSQIQEEYLELYRNLAAKKSGIAVARLSVEKCSICGSHFQEGSLSRLKKGPAISECPSCHRMIVVRFEDAFDAQADHLEE